MPPSVVILQRTQNMVCSSENSAETDWTYTRVKRAYDVVNSERTKSSSMQYVTSRSASGVSPNS